MQQRLMLLHVCWMCEQEIVSISKNDLVRRKYANVIVDKVAKNIN